MGWGEENAEYRKAARDAICRHCDKLIKRGDMMVSLYSWRNRGQHIHFHPKCVEYLASLITSAGESKE